MNIRNNVRLIGNLGADPEVRQFENGTTKAKFSLATSKKYKNREGELIQETQWHNIVVWGKLAEVIGRFLKKGSSVDVSGELTYREYTDKEGVKRYITEIVMEQFVPHSYEKTESQPAPPKPEPAATAESDDDLPF